MPINVELHTIIDAGRQPELKAQLLGGQLNVAACPACQHKGVMSSPLLYHDGDKEFLGVLVPQQIDMTEAERQKIIGDMTTTLMDSLPPEQRKGYLFQARQFLTLPSMLDAILIADGVTREQLETQRSKMRLIQRFLDAQGNEDVLQAIAKENDAALDYEFFSLLSAMAEQARQEGQTSQADGMLAVRDKLLDIASWGQESRAERELVEQLGGITTPEQLVDKLVAVQEDEELEKLVTLVRPLLDYGFFQTLTARIDAVGKEGQKKEAARLRARRSRLLELTDKLDKEAERAAERAAAVLRKLLASEDLHAAVREHREEIDDMVLAVLSMNLQEAEKSGATEAVSRLQAIWQAVTDMLQESMPPEVRFINELLDLGYPQGTQQHLESNRERVTGPLLEAMELIAKDLEGQGRAELAKRLRDIRGQAVLLV
jgi:hypothetical protein